MDGTTIHAIADLAKAGQEVQEVKGEGGARYLVLRSWAEDGRLAEDVKLLEEPRPELLQLYSLQALVAYLSTNPDKLEVSSLVVVIEGPAGVRLVGRVSLADGGRSIHARADLLKGVEAFPFGVYLPAEQFIIGLQTQFQSSDKLAELLQLVSMIRAEHVRTAADNGVSQEVTVRKGISMSTIARVPNPWRLAPYRTFRELGQPGSDFLLRLRDGAKEGEPPQLMLVEADGGTWRLEAMEGIAAYLRRNLPESCTPALLA